MLCFRTYNFFQEKKMNAFVTFGQVRDFKYIYGYGIEDGKVTFLKKNVRSSRWNDSFIHDNENNETILIYQNCFGDTWVNDVKPALDNTPEDDLIVVKVFPPDRYFYVKKRHIVEEGRGNSLFTVVSQ
jgi:hypothetical protein